MRTVSFSDRRVQKLLNDEFVCTYSDTTGDPSAGASFAHAPDSAPGPCGRGAGRQNVQTMFLTVDNEIFHVASGFLSPDDLLKEIKFAKELFAEMQRKPEPSEKTVADAHRSRLRKMGFSASQIAASDNQLTDMFLGGPNPQDFGMNLPGGGSHFFQNISDQRVLKDNRFMIQNPLATRKQFEQNPQALVGRNKTFFGSHPGMNVLSDKAVDSFNVRRSVRGR